MRRCTALEQSSRQRSLLEHTGRRDDGQSAELFGTKFGQSLITWVGNTVTYPPQGSITASTDLWIDVEAYPKDAAAGGLVGADLAGETIEFSTVRNALWLIMIHPE